MKTSIIYVAAVQKQQKGVACFGITSSKKNSKKPKEYAGIYKSKNRIEAQLKALIHSISLAEEAEEIILYSESNVVHNFANGDVGTWELADWCKGNGKSIDFADLWKELSGLVESKNVQLKKPKNKKDMIFATKLMNAEKEKPEVPMVLDLGNLTEKYAVDYVVSELEQEEADVIVEEIKRETQAKLTQEDTDNLISKAKTATKKEKKAVKKENTGKKNNGMTATAKVLESLVKQPEKEETTGIFVALDHKTLNACEKLFEELGLDTATAVKMYLKEAIRENRIPLDLKLD